MQKWKKLGFEQKRMDAVVRNMEASLDLWWSESPSPPADVEHWAFCAYSDAMIVFSMALIDYPMPNPPLNDYYEAARRLISATVYYFFGPWRDSFKHLLKDYDRQSARAKLHWIDGYRKGLAVALSLSDWESADQLLQWPGPDLPVDDGSYDRTTQDNAYHIWLASRLRGEPESVCSEQRAIVETSTRRRPKMLMAAADAMFADDSEGFTAALEKYLRHYRKNEFVVTGATDFGFCIEGAILWHAARRRELELKQLPDDVDIFIPKP